MKKTVLCSLIVLCLSLIMCVSCQKGPDVEKMLAYEDSESEYDINFSVGEYEYPMQIKLSGSNDNYVRDGRAEIAGGVLDKVAFEMKDGALKMIVSDLEYTLSEKDCLPVYALFSSFAIKEDDFISVTSEEASDEMKARFGGKYEHILIFNEKDFSPVKVETQTENGVCTVVFENTGTSEKVK